MTSVIKPFASLSFLILLLLSAGCGKEDEQQGGKHLEKADEYFAAENYNAARISYLNVLEDDRKNVPALSKLGEIWMLRGSSIQALPYLLAVKSLAPDLVDSRSRLAVALASIGRHNEALEEAHAVLDLDPQHEKTSLFLAQLVRTPAEEEKALSRFKELKDAAPSTYHLCLATLAFRQNDRSTGEAELEKALAADPSSHLANLGFARVYAFDKNNAKAVEHFEKAIPDIPRYAKARTAYPGHLHQSGDLEGARTRLESIIKDTDDHLPARELLTKIYLEEKSYDKASTLIEGTLALDPSNFEALLQKGRALRMQGKYDEALTHLQSALQIKIYDDNPTILLDIAQTHLALKDSASAIAALKTATARTNPAPEAQFLLASLQLKTGQTSMALAELESILEKHPGHRKSLILLADAHRALGQWDKAAIVYKDLVEQNDRDPIALLSLASTLQAQGKLEEAREHFLQALAMAPNNIYVHTQLLELDLHEKKFESAHARIDGLLSLKPELGQVHYLKARIQHAERNWPDAINSLQKAAELSGMSDENSILLISCHLGSGDRVRALEELEKFEPSITDNPRSLLAVALYFEELEKFDRARKAHKGVLKLSPDTIPSLNNLAVLYVEHFGEIDKARTLIDRARELAPDDHMIMDTLGWVRYHQGEFSQALALLQKSSPPLATNQDAQYHLGMAAYMMARADLAIPVLTKITDRGGDSLLTPQKRVALLEDYLAPEGQTPESELVSILKNAPDDVIALILHARALEKAGDPPAAKAALERAIKVNGQLPGAHAMLARIEWEHLDNDQAARAHAQTARTLEPENAEAAALLGRLAHHDGNYRQAHTLLTESNGRRPLTPAAKHDLALATYYIRNTVEAEGLMREVLRDAPGEKTLASANQFLEMTQAASSPEQLSKLSPRVAEILAAQPDHIPALFAHAKVLSRDGDAKNAETTLRRILDKVPGFFPATKEIAILLAEDENRLDEAKEHAIKAREAAPRDPALARTLARINFLQNNFSYAIQLYEQSARDQELDARSVYALGTAYCETGEKTKGAEALNRALQMGLTGADATAARKTLEDLK